MENSEVFTFWQVPVGHGDSYGAQAAYQKIKTYTVYCGLIAVIATVSMMVFASTLFVHCRGDDEMSGYTLTVLTASILTFIASLAEMYRKDPLYRVALYAKNDCKAKKEVLLKLTEGSVEAADQIGKLYGEAMEKITRAEVAVRQNIVNRKGPVDRAIHDYSIQVAEAYRDICSIDVSVYTKKEF